MRTRMTLLAVLILLGALVTDAYAVDYEIVVTTGTATGAGTDADVFIVLTGASGSSQERTLDNQQNNFENGATDTFTLTLPDVGELQTIKIRHNNTGFGPGWFLDKVVVRNPSTNKTWNVPCQRWLARDEEDGKIERELPVQ